jgi:hypothetical protein
MASQRRDDLGNGFDASVSVGATIHGLHAKSRRAKAVGERLLMALSRHQGDAVECPLSRVQQLRLEAINEAYAIKLAA